MIEKVSVLQEHDIETPYGILHVMIRGAPKGNKPAILTYHDVGLNREYPHIGGIYVCVPVYFWDLANVPGFYRSAFTPLNGVNLPSHHIPSAGGVPEIQYNI